MSNEYIIKLVLVDDGTTGKTSIRKRYMGKGFSYSHFTILGASFANKELIIDTDENGKPISKISFRFWDVAGQPAFETIRKRFV